MLISIHRVLTMGVVGVSMPAFWLQVSVAGSYTEEEREDHAPVPPIPSGPIRVLDNQ